ncbi:sensor histidine kinase [Romboutsia timonensis]|uniref:sensor histidine kinase n=1 Tax=Romboutsia timonensis TaxID=1776391 RepID=UPI0023F83E3B|nr:HAMP domain-containing sensor histidine kinase [Romboutsia timonensis]MCI6667129.1 HAMP domain-containing histidine kinase [Romboutsia timonensis]MDY3001663.1 HAMP domain-containing sensor histidine kinase [Romboutsia timonensis]MDY3959764.1 HAMP domain-containing sensor histidine kinase [Romboutsia timonensis]
MINKKVFNKTKSSLIKINIAVVLSFLILFSIFIYTYFKGVTYKSIDNKLNNELESIAIQLTRQSMVYPVTKYPSNMIYIYKRDRVMYYTPQNGYFSDVLPNRYTNKLNDIFTFSENGYTFRELNVEIDEYQIQIIRNIDSEISSLRQLIFVFIIGILISLIITYYLAVYLTKKALIPIETAWNNQAKFIQDASHELRTPISIISSKLERMLKHPNSTISDEVETIADAMSEIRRSKKMISDLLSLTKEEAITKLNITEVNIKNFIKDICVDYVDIADIQEKRFEMNFNLKNETIFTDENKLRQLLLIFIDNAFKYTKENDFIAININQKDNVYTEISIIDSGVGIKQEDIPYIFDRFFRSENVRDKDIDGSGIGLSIAKMIAINLGVEISVKCENNKTEFKIIIQNNKCDKIT